MKRIVVFAIILLGVGFVSSCNKEGLAVVDDVCTKMDDIKFMDYCYTNFDVNHDGKVSMSEAAAVHRIYVKSRGINSLKGIEYFTALTELDCTYNSIPSLDVSKNTALVKLDCSSSKLTNLDVSNNAALIELRCNYNQLTSLDVSKDTALETLQCYYNQLTSIDVSNNTALYWFWCYNNQLTSLDVSNNLSLHQLSCKNNPDLKEIWLKEGQSIASLIYDIRVTIKRK